MKSNKQKQNFLKKFQIRARDNPIITGLLTFIVLWIIQQAIAGIIEYYSLDFWSSIILPWFQKVLVLQRYILLVPLIVGMVIGWIANDLFFKRFQLTKIPITTIHEYIKEIHNKESQLYLLLSDQINKLNQKLLANSNQENNIIDDFFLTLFSGLGPDDINGGGILLKDEHDPEYLYFWRMSPDQSLSPKRFYIGKQKNYKSVNSPKGVAGHVFLSGKPEIVNILDKATVRADNQNFHKFDLDQLGHPRYVTPYSSFICLPILFSNSVVGVLSIESQKLDSFDEESKTYLQPIANQLGSILFSLNRIE